MASLLAQKRVAMSSRSVPQSIMLCALSLATATLSDAQESHAQQRLLVSGNRLQSMRRRVPPGDAELLTLRTRLPMEPLAASQLRCLRISRGIPSSSPVLMTDGSIVLTTATPHALLWFENGVLRREFEVGQRLVGPPAEGADGRVVVVDDNNVLHSYAPDGTARTVVSFAGRVRSGALPLNDGSVAVALEQGAGSEIAVVSPSFASMYTIPVNGRIDRVFSRGNDGTILFSANTGVLALSGDRAEVQVLPWARNAVDAWALQEQTVAVLMGTPPAGEVRFASMQGVIRSTLPAKEALFATGRGHLVFSRGFIPDPTAAGGTTGPTSGSTASTGPTAPTPATTPRPGVRPVGRIRPHTPFGTTISETPANTHTELLLYSSEGRQISRVALPIISVLAVMLDPDDSMLVLTTDGHAIAIDPGGVLRWNVDLHTPLSRPPVALPDGGWAMSVGGATPGLCTVRY